MTPSSVDPNPSLFASGPRQTEVVYVAADGEFIRQAYVERFRYRCQGGLPERIVFARWAGNLKELGVSRFSATIAPEVAEQAFKEVEFVGKTVTVRGADITNCLIRNELRTLGFSNPRRFPAVEFYIDDLFYYPSYERSPVGRSGGNQWCHLFTSGDPEDLHQFAKLLGLDRSAFVDPGDHLWRYDLTPGKRNIARARGAKEVGYYELSALLRRREEHRF